MVHRLADRPPVWTGGRWSITVSGGTVAPAGGCDIMVRLLLSHQLVLAVLVGPLLCCCARGRLTPDVSADSHCCGHSSPSEPGPARPAPRCPADCPCKTADRLVSTAATVRPGELSDGVSISLLECLDPRTIPAQGTQSDSRPGGRPVSPAPGQFVFLGHILRC